MQALHRVAFIAALAVFGSHIAAAAAAADQSNRAQNNSGRRMRFQGMDRDGDGVITRTEWRGNAHVAAPVCAGDRLGYNICRAPAAK